MKISVVIPVFNSDKTITNLVDGILSNLKKHNIEHEIILIDDGSTDSSWKELEKLSHQNLNVRSLKLLKNYGQHTANLCGFKNSEGTTIITMDDDLQNPPSEIIKLIEEIDKGFDLVYGVYIAKQHGLIRGLGSKIVTRLNKRIFDIKGEFPLSNFRAVSREVIERVINEASSRPYIPGLILKNSDTISTVKVNHDERREGKSRYTLPKLISLVLDLLFQHSNIPLRLISIFGFAVSLTSFILGGYILFDALFNETDSLPGWSSLAVLISFLGGMLILSISVIGEYLIRILRQLPQNKIYTLVKVINK